MRDAWVAECIQRSCEPAEFYTGCRKIHTGVTIEISGSALRHPVLRIEDCGFTHSKLSMLRRLYWSDEHAAQVRGLWEARVAKGRYGSVSVSTYHHLTKSDPEKRSKRASVMGPCLIGVSATLLDRRTIAIDAFYRTTELFKKFPADLVFIRDTVLPGIGVRLDAAHGDVTVERLRCHVANATAHPMYAVTWLPHCEDMIQTLELIRSNDRRFFDWVLKWTGRYVCPEYHRGIAKFAQAMRVQKDALNRITGERLRTLQEFIRDNHPGYRGEYVDDDDSEDE